MPLSLNGLICKLGRSKSVVGGTGRCAWGGKLPSRFSVAAEGRPRRLDEGERRGEGGGERAKEDH